MVWTGCGKIGFNWHKIDPNGNEEDDEEDDEDMEFYRPTMHNPETFVPTYVHDLIPHAERREFMGPKEDFEKLRDLLANHLQILYREGKLRYGLYVCTYLIFLIYVCIYILNLNRWPMTRKEIETRFNI